MRTGHAALCSLRHTLQTRGDPDERSRAVSRAGERTLSTPPDAAYEMALRLLRSEGAHESSPSGIVAAAGDRVLQKLQRALARWFGAQGCRALLVRAIERTRVAHPALEVVQIAESAGESGVVVAPDALTALRSLPSEVVMSACASVIAEIVTLLDQLVGEDVARRIVDHGWMEAGSKPPPGPGENRQE